MLDCSPTIYHPMSKFTTQKANNYSEHEKKHDDLAQFEMIAIDQGICFPNIISLLETQVCSLENDFSQCAWQSGTTLEYFATQTTISPENDYLIKLVEDIVLLVRDLSRSSKKSDYVLAIITFAKLRSNGSLTKLLLDKWESIVNMEFQGDDKIPLFTGLRGLLENYEKVKKLPVFQKLYKFLLYCVGSSLFEKMGIKFNAARYMKVEKAALKRDYNMGPDFVHCMLDTALFLCETGYQCMVTGSMEPFLHTENVYEQWHLDCELLKSQSRYISNPEPHGFTVFDFLNRLDSAIEKGNSIVKFQKQDDVATKICKYTLNELNIIRADCLTKRLAQQDRKAPFALLISGGSSVGKSTFTKLLYYHFGKKFSLPIDPEYRYVRNPFDQYWTNFNSSQWCVQLDDIAFLHPNSSQGCDPSLMEMLQVVNNVPYVPTQADIQDKGKTPLRARFVIATTNTDTLNAETYFACPLAVQRRLPYVVTILPKKEYLKDNFMLDTSKLPAPKDGEYPDFWNITVRKVRPAQKKTTHMGQTAELEDIAIFQDINLFLKWFNKIAEEAEGIQQASMDCDAFMGNVNLCPCGISENQCTEHSMPLQTSEIIEFNTEWVQSVMERNPSVQFEQEDTHEDSVEKYFWKNIMFEISKMSLLTRIIVWYYITILYYMHKSLWFRLFMSYVFGSWYWLWLMSYLLHYPEVRHISLYFLGLRTYQGVCRNKKAIILAAALTTMLSVYKAISWIRSTTEDDKAEIKKSTFQGVSAERGESPEPKGDKQENVWYRDTYECTQFDVPEQSLSKTNWTADETKNFLKSNCVHFTARWCVEGKILKTVTCRAICLVGNVYMVNNHCISSDTFNLQITSQQRKDGITENIELLVSPSQIVRSVERDLMFIELPVPPKKDIRSFFAKSSYQGRFDGEYLGRNADGSLYHNKVTAPKLVLGVEKYNEKQNTLVRSDMWKGNYEIETQSGDCGSMLLSYTSMGPLILGMHVLGSDTPLTAPKRGFALKITQEDLSFLDNMQVQGGRPNFQVGNYKMTLGELSKRSPVRYIENGTLEVYGSFIGFRGKMKSRVCKTYMSDLAVEHGYVRNTAPPMMNSWIPWRKALLDMTRPVTDIRLDVLQIVKQCFIDDILGGLSSESLSELIVYDNVTAINGKPGLAYVDKLNRNTSAGFPFRKSKKFFLTASEPIGELQHPVVITDEIQEEVDRIITEYENLTCVQPVFTASLKDEPTAIKKCIEGKTRVFCGAPMPWSIVVRKYLLSTIRVIQKNRFLFEAGPGTIAQSKEWDDIYQYVTQYGEDRIVAGDYGKFDKRMPSSVIQAAFSVIIAMLEKAGWSDRDIRVVKGIATDTAFPTIDFNGDLIRCYGTNPSGHPLTVIINGLANSLYVRYCYFLANPDLECHSFQKNTSLMTYGDDMIMGVSSDISWFNHTVIKEQLANIDIEFTMADKEALSVPFINISEATFLRRSWRFEPELGFRVCPIEHASIDKMLTMCVKSKTISLELQAIEVMNTVVREYFWYGREIFEEKRALMNYFIEELNLQEYVERDLPTWESLKGEYLLASQLR
nr:MAG: hypothetical protein 1 [Marnaviridae sp.]